MVVGYDQIWAHVNWLHCTLIGTVSRRRRRRRRWSFVCMMHGTVNEISNKHAALIIHARADANIDDASRVSSCVYVCESAVESAIWKSFTAHTHMTAAWGGNEQTQLSTSYIKMNCVTISLELQRKCGKCEIFFMWKFTEEAFSKQDVSSV